jgi:hypothetical protein
MNNLSSDYILYLFLLDHLHTLFITSLKALPHIHQQEKFYFKMLSFVDIFIILQWVVHISDFTLIYIVL